jgi:hypothetical protein
MIARTHILLSAANPDLPDRILNGYPLTAYDRDTLYEYTEEGYTTQVCPFNICPSNANMFIASSRTMHETRKEFTERRR